MTWIRMSEQRPQKGQLILLSTWRPSLHKFVFDLGEGRDWRSVYVAEEGITTTHEWEYWQPITPPEVEK